MSDLAALAEIAAAPEGSTPLSAVVVVAYLDNEGDECMGFSTHGDSTLTNLLGLMTWAQMRLLIDHIEEPPA